MSLNDKKEDTHNISQFEYKSEIEKLSKLLVRRDLELTKVNSELDEKILELEKSNKELLDMKDVLEIRLNAKTRQLREVISGLDQQVKERTIKLEKSQKALMNILEDIQFEKKIAQDERNKTDSIISNFSDGLLIFNNDNDLTTVNKMAEKYLNIKREKIEGRNIRNLYEVNELKSIIEVIGIDIKDVFRKEVKIDEENILELTVSSTKQDNKNISKFLILHNITREKKVQLLKTEFVSIAAHQLRTPLSAIKWTLTTLLDGDLGELNEQQINYLKKTNLSNERMIDLVDDLLNLSRIEEGKYIQVEDFIKIEDLVNEVLQEVEIKVNKKKLLIDFKQDKDISKISVDKEKIKLVIQNLVENAVNYCYEKTKIYISLTEDRKKNEIQFKITNSGIGIPEKVKRRMFTKFFRAENALKTETVGSGLGLFINKNIIESHGGKIWFDSEEGKDTIFYFILPIKKK
ncbi:MAG: ATP-binding protein [Patescibacteria group bacterium]|nr:ATP-binding protein [Patescibacteria group bacterium]